MKKIIVLLLITLFILISCNSDVSGISLAKVRVSAISTNNSNISFSVYPETSDGNIANGAVVYVVDENNVITHLTYNNSSVCYVGDIEGDTSNKFFVNVVSSGLGNREIKLIHNKLSAKPQIQTLRDSSGNSAISGNNIDKTKEIEISWNGLGEGVTYTVQVYSSISVLYVTSTKSLSVIIPENTLTAGNCTVYVSAQLLEGDATFKTSNIYSCSSVKSSGLNFNVK